MVVVHAADIQDYHGLKLVFEAIRGRFSRLKLVWADGMYQRMVDWVARLRPARPIRLEIVKRTRAGVQGPEAALGGGADVRLAGPVSPAEQGLRGDDRQQRGVGQAGDDPSDGPPFGEEIIAFSARSLSLHAWSLCQPLNNPGSPPFGQLG